MPGEGGCESVPRLYILSNSKLWWLYPITESPVFCVERSEIPRTRGIGWRTAPKAGHPEPWDTSNNPPHQLRDTFRVSRAPWRDVTDAHKKAVARGNRNSVVSSLFMAARRRDNALRLLYMFECYKRPADSPPCLFALFLESTPKKSALASRRPIQTMCRDRSGETSA